MHIPGTFRLPVFIFFPILLLISCEQYANKANISLNRIHSPEAGSNALAMQEPYIDTIFPMQIDSHDYQLILSHESFSALHEGEITTTVRIVGDKKHDTLYTNIFEFNTAGIIRHPAPDCYWFSLLNSGGGSSYSATLFNIKLKPEIMLQPILEFGELSFIHGNITGTELLVFEGIWNTNGGFESKNFESHFSQHQQIVSVYKIEEDTITFREIGLTKQKHDFHHNNEAIKEFVKKEPALAKEIDWSEYEM